MDTADVYGVLRAEPAARSRARTDRAFRTRRAHRHAALLLRERHGLHRRSGPRVRPEPDERHFSWDNGSRLYYANIATPFPAARRSRVPRRSPCRGPTTSPARCGPQIAWMPPVIVTRQNAALFSDKEQIWADNAASSPFFGNVYVCNVGFRGNGQAAPSRCCSPARPTAATPGRPPAHCRDEQRPDRRPPGLRDPHGQRRASSTSSGAGPTPRRAQGVFFQARSYNGGVKFERPRAITTVAGHRPVRSGAGPLHHRRCRGSPDRHVPEIDIANGAPSGAGATDRDRS